MDSEFELLLVRDEASADADLEARLRGLGASVTVLAHAPDTVDQVAVRDAALVVLDVARGGEALIDLAPRIAIRFGAVGPAVLAVIDSDEAELIERAFAQGVKDVLSRPVSAPLLRAMVMRNARKPEQTARA